MSKVNDIKNLKNLLDEKVINQQEFESLKKEILGTSIKVNKELGDEIMNDRRQTKSKETSNGILTVSYAGRWFLMDAKTKISINGEHNSTHSTKKGFSVDIPLESDTMTLKVTLGGMNKMVFELKELNVKSDYHFELQYDTMWGQYSDNYKLKENGKSIH